MIAKITYSKTKQVVLQIRGYQRYVEEDEEFGYLIDLDGIEEYELSAYELLVGIYDEAGDIEKWESKTYHTVEFLTDAMVSIESIEFKEC